MGLEHNLIVLGGGMTGLGVGLSGLPVYEAAETPGGICSSYYVKPEEGARLAGSPVDESAYRFEIGGGHWIFGANSAILRLIRSYSSVRSYARLSSVWFPDKALRVPYPIQNHLGHLGSELASRCLREIAEANSAGRRAHTLGDWLRQSFGRTLCDLFFGPFHELYTAGLWERIAPQDAYKSPISLGQVIEGAIGSAPAVGYNTTFIYPTDGLNTLAQRMAGACDIHYGKRAVRIDPEAKEVHFADGSAARYATLVSTLPLNRTISMAGLRVSSAPDPSPSVLVLNIGAVKGASCPDDHWLYVPSTRSGFHRVGFYSNVDSSFLPKRCRKSGDRVSIYVERAYPEGQAPDDAEVSSYGREVVRELQDWGWIGKVEVLDPTWIEVAYTWSWAGSSWKQEAIAVLEARDIIPVGRYARWVFQGIADSIRDGLTVGAAIQAGERAGALRSPATNGSLAEEAFEAR
jgi:protoporphyrinogen oxidase